MIVLFDQMVPRYADQFHMPNFRKLRDAGTNYKQAYLGYMASETVIAHNVIPSGLNPKNMGYTDEAYRDTGNVFNKGADAMHITGDLSLDDFATIQKNHGRPYPKLADYLHAARPGTKFITVGEKSYAGMRRDSTREAFRTADVMPTILKAMGIRPTSKTDGRAHSLGH